jgi:hypothetical protein
MENDEFWDNYHSLLSQARMLHAMKSRSKALIFLLTQLILVQTVEISEETKLPVTIVDCGCGQASLLWELRTKNNWPVQMAVIGIDFNLQIQTIEAENALFPKLPFTAVVGDMGLFN